MDYARVGVSSQSNNAQPLDTNFPNSNFAVNYSPSLSFGNNDLDVAIQSLSINVGPQSGKDSLTNLDIFVLSNVVAPTTITADQMYPILARATASQVNQRITIDFSNNLSWGKCPARQFSQLTFQIVTDTFIASKGASRDFANIHTPHNANATTLSLVWRRRIPMVGDYELSGNR